MADKRLVLEETSDDEITKCPFCGNPFWPNFKSSRNEQGKVTLLCGSCGEVVAVEVDTEEVHDVVPVPTEES